MKKPTGELEALKRLEYAGAQAAYADAEWACCPVCGLTDPSERVSEHQFDGPVAIARDVPPGPNRERRLAEYVDSKVKDKRRSPLGPRHEEGCWLAQRIADLEAHDVFADPEWGELMASVARVANRMGQTSIEFLDLLRGKLEAL